MRESGMKGSIVLDEGETFDTKTDNLNKNRVMEATPYDNELPCEQGLPGVPGVDESNVIGDDDKEYEYHEKKDSFSSEEESTQKDLEPTNDMKESGMGGSISHLIGWDFIFRRDLWCRFDKFLFIIFKLFIFESFTFIKDK
jgi:hypothetical protein